VASVAGAACVVLVAVAVAAVAAPDSAVVPGGGDRTWSAVYLGAAAAAFVAYLAGLYALRRGGRTLAFVLGIAALVQLAPAFGPVVLSTDVYTYWDYGRIAAVHGGNPYEDEPRMYPDDPAYARMGADWRDTTSVYGPGFTLASEAHAAAVGESPDAAAYAYKALAGLAILATALFAGMLAGPFAAAFAGWNPLLALHFAGGGHNDAWMMALVLGALALRARGRPQLAGAAWAASIAVKWVSLVFLPLRALEARQLGIRVGHAGFVAAAAVVVAVATWRYGFEWLGALGPTAGNLADQSRYSLPGRLAALGVPEDAASLALATAFALAYAWLLLEAWRGRARLALAAGLLLLATPWLLPWYGVWAVALAAVEDDAPARVLALGISAYLLWPYVPL
jgi:hypothetical protein